MEEVREDAEEEICPCRIPAEDDIRGGLGKMRRRI
jgi:hypothetical protein